MSRRRAPGRTPELALGTVLVLVAVGLFWSARGHWRQGLVIVGSGLLLAAVLRLVLPLRRVGLLAVRSRPFDVVLLTAMGVGIIVVTVVVPYNGV